MATEQDIVPMVICIREKMPIIRLVREVIVRSVAVGANFICFLPEKNYYSVFCSNGKRVIAIQIQSLDERGGALFFSMVSRLKILLGMKITERKTSQSRKFEKAGDLPAFKAITIPTKFGESIQINFL